jgi:hypothetical protein
MRCGDLLTPAHEKFGNEVPAEVLGDPTRVRSKGASGLVEYEAEWTYVQRVLDGDMEE